MIIHGLQKLTLLDYPEKMACTVFTPGCNFKCPFCHNSSLVRGDGDRISEDEFFKFLNTRKNILEGVCITGGEPTLQPDLSDFIRKIKDMGFLVKLDTNGYKPEVLKALAGDGLLDYVAMDIKNSKDKYAKTCGLEEFDIEKIKESVDFLINGSLDFEFRTTVVRDFHDENDILNISEWIKGAKKYYLQKFVDSDDLISNNCSGYENSEMENLINRIRDRVEEVSGRGF